MKIGQVNNGILVNDLLANTFTLAASCMSCSDMSVGLSSGEGNDDGGVEPDGVVGGEVSLIYEKR
jgi:hypothetical protein